nr:transposase [Nitrosococcus wardiae]
MKKHQRQLEGFDEKVLALYARGLSTREIKAQLEERYGVEASLTLISNVTDAVLEEVRVWQSRPLSAVYPILYVVGVFLGSQNIKKDQKTTLLYLVNSD